MERKSSDMADTEEHLRIPIVDFTEVAVTLDDNEIPSASLQSCAEQIVEALSGIGFVYVRNHGIPKEQVQEAFRLSKEFFSLDSEVKRSYKEKSCQAMNRGFIDIGKESLDPRYYEVRESFNVDVTSGFNFPKEVEGFEAMIIDFFASCSKLALRMLTLMGLGLKLEDKNVIKNCHVMGMGSKDNESALRLIYYPPLVKKEDVIRCGEHSDYGSLTLLFQDDVGGLQVKNRDGSYVDATPIEDCVLINVGDLMQRWTSDRLVSTKHRVLVPNSEELQKKARYSIAFFVSPDNNAVVECLDKSNKYPPLKTADHFKKRFRETYAGDD